MQPEHKYRVTFMPRNPAYKQSIVEYHRSKADYQLRANALNWTILEVVKL